MGHGSGITGLGSYVGGEGGEIEVRALALSTFPLNTGCMGSSWDKYNGGSPDVWFTKLLFAAQGSKMGAGEGRSL